MEVNFHLKLKFRSFSFKLKDQEAYAEGERVVRRLGNLEFLGGGGEVTSPSVALTLNPTFNLQACKY